MQRSKLCLVVCNWLMEVEIMQLICRTNEADLKINMLGGIPGAAQRNGKLMERQCQVHLQKRGNQVDIYCQSYTSNG